MIKINNKIAYANAEKLTEHTNSKKIFWESIHVLVPDKSNWIRKLVLSVFEIITAIIMGKQVNTIVLTNDVFQIFMTVILALIAIVFTGYAFFQALINDKLLITLLSVSGENSDNLSDTNKYFAKVMMFQIACLLLDLGIIIFTMILPESWCLLQNRMINEIIAISGLFILFHINVESIWEMKSFIFNVFQLFNLHAYSRMVMLIEKENEEEKQDK